MDFRPSCLQGHFPPASLCIQIAWRGRSAGSGRFLQTQSAEIEVFRCIAIPDVRESVWQAVEQEQRKIEILYRMTDFAYQILS